MQDLPHPLIPAITFTICKRHNEKVATTIIDFIKEGKIDKNTAFITFDDNVWFKLFDITSIKQNSALFVSTLLDVIKKGDFNETIYIDSKLMERKLTLSKQQSQK